MKSNKVDYYRISIDFRRLTFSGLLSGGRTYEITGKTNAATKFTIRNELFNIGKKLFLLEDGEEPISIDWLENSC